LKTINKYFYKLLQGYILFGCTCFIFFSSFIFNNDWREINPENAANELIQINKRIMKNNKYSFNVNYTSFREHNETSAYESIYGIVIRDGINLYSKVNGALTIQNKKLRIVIDSAKQFIKITDPLEGQDPNFNMNDYVKVMGVCKSVKRKEQDKVIAYRFEPKATSGIVAQEIYMGEDFMNKSVIYYANEHNVRENNKIISQTVYPRLEINISNFKKLDKINIDTFNTDNIIILNKKQIELKEKYKTFKFFDGRIKK